MSTNDNPNIQPVAPDVAALRASLDQLRIELHEEADRSGGDHVAVERLMERRENGAGLVTPYADDLPPDRRLLTSGF